MDVEMMSTIDQIQGAVANRLGMGMEDMDPLVERFVEQGYDEDQVREVVERAIVESIQVHAA